jgi:predicted glycogen debranching enzyme
MRYCFEADVCRNYASSSRIEWILPNGIGGFAMGTVAGANSRRYHGHLVAATNPPADRTNLLGNVEAIAKLNGKSYGVSTNQYVGAVHPSGYLLLDSFTVGEYAEWVYGLPEGALTKRLGLKQGRNSATLQYINETKYPLELLLRPLVMHNYYHDTFRSNGSYPDDLRFAGDRTAIENGGTSLTLYHPNAERMPVTGWYFRFELQREQERGLDALMDMYCPAELTYKLAPGESVELVASDDGDVEPMQFAPMKPRKTRGPLTPVLKDAVEKFVVETEDRASILAGYPWFTDWGRDTMIALPGVCLCTGRYELARRILRSYAKNLNNGLIPNRFTESGAADYNTVDATLWFAHAVYKTLQYEPDKAFAEEAFVWLKEIFKHHMAGTDFGIGVDKQDGLLTQGESGVQLTWMDAKVGDWVVTPRHGKPVEINGLWVNALRVMAEVASQAGSPRAEFEDAAQKAEESFDKKFWKQSVGYYMDTVDPDDASLRPNQVIAIGLPFGPAKGEHAKEAMRNVTEHLLTDHGLRTLKPGNTSYKGRYEGDMTARDAAYHQGTVWPWLLGPYCSALARTGTSAEDIKKQLQKTKDFVYEFGVGGIAEVYDGDEPQRPSGCPWQAWSAAEILRAWQEDAKQN